ncbi:hypothetical protein LTR37_020426, partial [Vermiconidia calcicola]
MRLDYDIFETTYDARFWKILRLMPSLTKLRVRVDVHILAEIRDDDQKAIDDVVKSLKWLKDLDVVLVEYERLPEEYALDGMLCFATSAHSQPSLPMRT